jgi:hypothetical protein
MSQPAAARVLDREFLTMRCKLLDLAAALDRVGRGSGDLAGEQRVELIYQALELLADRGAKEKAAAIQLLFSLPYDAAWQKTFEQAKG